MIRVVVCLLILRSLSAMLRGLKKATKFPKRPRKSECMRGDWNMKDDYDEAEDEDEEEGEEGECFSVDSLENGKPGRVFNSKKIKISTVSLAQ